MPLSGAAKNLQTTTGTVNVGNATAPSSGQVLTATGTTAATWQTLSSASVLTSIPLPVAVLDPATGDSFGTRSLNNNSYMDVAQVNVPYDITVNQVSFIVSSVLVGGQFKITLYGEEGRSSIFTATTGTLQNFVEQMSTASVSAVKVSAGVYYVGVNTVSSFSGQVQYWNTDVGQPGMAFIASVTGKPVIQGQVSIASGAPPAAITSSVLASTGGFAFASRWDT